MNLKMSLFIGVLAAAAVPALAMAAPAVRVENAAARVIVIPENRSDIAVSINQGRAGLNPMAIRHDGGVLVVDGGYGGPRWSWGPRTFGISGGWNGFNCHGGGDHIRVSVPGKGEVPLADLPAVTIRTPMDVNVGGAGAVFGDVGPSASLELSDAGCGDWKVADVRGAMAVTISGSGDVAAHNAGGAQVRISGSGDLAMGQVNGGLDARTSGSGDIRVASVHGPLTARISGSGDTSVDGGEAAQVEVQIAGSGDFRFRGVAGAVNASVAGSGDIVVARATGPVSKHVAGSGDISVGR